MLALKRSRGSSRRRLRFDSLESRRLLAVTVLDFEELNPEQAYRDEGATVTYLQYSNEGFDIESDVQEGAANLNGRWRMSLPGDSRYTGSQAISSVWAPVTITLSQTDGTPFSISSIDLYPWLPFYNPSVSFTGLTAGGDTVAQEFELLGTKIQTYEFDSSFTNLTSLSWGYTGFDDYHTFDNVVLNDQGAIPVEVDVDDVIDLKRDKQVVATVFSDPDFDPADLDLDSLELVVNEVALDVAVFNNGRQKIRWKDVNGDGVNDLVVAFAYDSSQFSEGSYQATLTGGTDLANISGEDAGTILDSAKGKGSGNGKPNR